MNEIPESVLQKQLEILKESMEFKSEDVAKQSAVVSVDHLVEQVSALGGTIEWSETAINQTDEDYDEEELEEDVEDHGDEDFDDDDEDELATENHG